VVHFASMVRTGGIAAAALVATTLAAPALAQAPGECPQENRVESGTVTWEATSYGLVGGYAQGEGTLTLEGGETHEIATAQFMLGVVGYSEQDVEGTVYNLQDLDDFDGTYFGPGGEITLAKGAGIQSVTNARCVTIDIVVTADGLNVKGPIPSGIEISRTDKLKSK